MEIKFEGVKNIQEYLQVILKTFKFLVCLNVDVGGYYRGGGVKISCSKNGFLGFLRARRAFGAHQVFGTTFGHIQNFSI